MAEAAPATHGATIDPGASVTAYDAAGHIIPIIDDRRALIFGVPDFKRR